MIQRNMKKKMFLKYSTLGVLIKNGYRTFIEGCFHLFALCVIKIIGKIKGKNFKNSSKFPKPTKKWDTNEVKSHKKTEEF